MSRRIKKVRFGWMSDIDVSIDSQTGDVDIIAHMIDGYGNRRCGQIMFNANDLVEGLEHNDLCAFHIGIGLPCRPLPWLCECGKYNRLNSGCPCGRAQPKETPCDPQS